jgi:hypothetical protein
VILPTLSIVGKIPESIKLLKKVLRMGEIIIEQCLIKCIGMSLALPFERSEIILLISSLSHIDKNILEDTDGFI